MSWEKVEIQKPHHCGTPTLVSMHPELSVGDVIKCTDCGQHWKHSGTDSGMQWDPYPARFVWKAIDPPGTSGRIQGR